MAGLGEFKAEAGIVNFYQPGDSLTSHVDRSEKRMDVPLISVSVGASCAFVLGGETREEVPVAVVLHSGDALFLTGRARRCYHGVPVILEPSFGLCGTSEEEKTALDILAKGRINLNMRQVK
jgi:alkylated DNA repair protein alkB family protein 1